MVLLDDLTASFHFGVYCLRQPQRQVQRGYPHRAKQYIGRLPLQQNLGLRGQHVSPQPNDTKIRLINPRNALQEHRDRYPVTQKDSGRLNRTRDLSKPDDIRAVPVGLLLP